MTLLDILDSPVTNLPLKPVPVSEFRRELAKRLDAFGDLFDQLDDHSASIPDLPFHSTIHKEHNKTLRVEIQRAVDAYFEGKPSFAYGHLKKGIDEGRIRNRLDKESQVPQDSNFFRIREEQSNFPLARKDMFHIPFEKRGIVRTQRYSIPGLPSLYLSNSVYSAWEELLRPNSGSVQAIRLSNTRPLRLLDLANDIYNDQIVLNENLYRPWYPLYKVVTWPLVAACSFKVYEPSNTFKPEYIIPQLLTQWINMDSLDGIRFSSSHIDGRKINGRCYNYVFPVKTCSAEVGLCAELTGLFRSTDVIPLEVRGLAASSDRFHSQGSITRDVNPDIESIELVGGESQPYAATAFGILEHALNYLPLQSLADSSD